MYQETGSNFVSSNFTSNQVRARINNSQSGSTVQFRSQIEKHNSNSPGVKSQVPKSRKFEPFLQLLKPSDVQKSIPKTSRNNQKKSKILKQMSPSYKRQYSNDSRRQINIPLRNSRFLQEKFERVTESNNESSIQS